MRACSQTPHCNLSKDPFLRVWWSRTSICHVVNIRGYESSKVYRDIMNDLYSSGDYMQYDVHKKTSLANSKTTGHEESRQAIGLAAVNDEHTPPPKTMNIMSPRAHVGIGELFSICSRRDGLVGFLPARAALANSAFFCRRSRAFG